MPGDGQIVFEVTADGKHAIADIKDITRAIQRETREWDNAAEKSTDNINSNFSGMLKKLVAGFSAAKIGKALLDIGKEAVSAASDLQEVQNVVDTTFGDGAKKIESWAKTAGMQFGLTETQAKRFTSTLGAMMKSSGLAGAEIVDMSTDLAGLAADMASFYNLDFEEAFQKIRSGISGETEPLKQLGINMSVANLNAYALKNGLSKTFDQMTQGEQTMLRYQYLMSATADAQGDFAKTSDGYANSMRALETQLTTLKTNLGNNILPVIQWAVSSINGLFGGEAGEGWARRRTVLDDVADIDANVQASIEKINSTKKVVDELVTSLNEVGGKKAELDAATGNVTTAAQGVATLATELSKVKIEGDAKEAFESTLTILKNNVGSLSAISGEDANGITDFLGRIEEKAAALTPDDVQGWQNLLGELNANIPGLANAQQAAEGVKRLATELSGVKIDGNAKETFEQTLAVLYANVDALSTVKGEDAQGVKDWLDGVATEAAKLNPDDAKAWETLVGALAQDVPALEGEDGETLISRLTAFYLSLGSESEEAAHGLAALGYGTEDIEAKQKDWLATCKELVRTMPGLADIIDTNTGEVKGGIPALKEYVDEWERMAKYQAQVEGIKQKKSLYEGLPEQSEIASDVRTKRATAKAYLMGYGKATEEDAEKALAGAELMAKTAYNGGGINGKEIDDYGFLNYSSLRTNASHAYSFFSGGKMFSPDPANLKATEDGTKKIDEALADYMESLYSYEEFIEVQPQMEAAYNQAIQETAEAFGVSTEAVKAEAQALEDAEHNMTTLAKAANGDADAIDAVTSAVNNASEALQSMADYAAGVRDRVVSAIDSTTRGFEYIGSASERQAKRLAPFEKEIAALDKTSADYEKRLADINARTSDAKDTFGIGNLTKNLQSQLSFLREYKADMEAARAMGFSNEFLSQFADGSVESAEWLHEIAQASGGQVKELNDLYASVTKGKEELTNTLTQQQLSADETYKTLAEKAKEAVAALDLGQEAAENAGKTVEGIADGIKSHVDSVAEQVDAILAQLNRLDGFGINIDFGGFGSISWTTSTGKNADSSGRFGIDYVPRDDYIIRAHEGERLLTAQENQIWNSLLNGGVAGFDLEDLGGVMRDNIKPGGSVFLDGKVVGEVISDRQGRTYKSLQRSGWQQ